MLRGMQFRGVWLDYQARVLYEMESHFDDRRLHVVAAPGAEKTVLGLEIIRRIGRPALVFSPTVAILEQWLQRLSSFFLDEPPLPSAISRDLADPRELTLATCQPLDSFRRSERLDEVIELLENVHRQQILTFLPSLAAGYRPIIRLLPQSAPDFVDRGPQGILYSLTV